MDALLIATGFTGALTLVWLVRMLHSALTTPPSLEVQIRPAGNWTDQVVGELRRARREVIVLAPLLAHRTLAQALVDLRLRRRVKVEVLLGYQAERDPRSDLAFLLEQHIQPLVDPDHDPGPGVVLIIDRRIVVTGNWQLTPVPEGQEEAVLVFKSHPEAVAQYVQNYLLHKAHVRPAALWPEAVQPRPAPQATASPPPAPQPEPRPTAAVIPPVERRPEEPPPPAPQPVVVAPPEPQFAPASLSAPAPVVAVPRPPVVSAPLAPPPAASPAPASLTALAPVVLDPIAAESPGSAPVPLAAVPPPTLPRPIRFTPLPPPPPPLISATPPAPTAPPVPITAVAPSSFQPVPLSPAEPEPETETAVATLPPGFDPAEFVAIRSGGVPANPSPPESSPSGINYRYPDEAASAGQDGEGDEGQDHLDPFAARKTAQFLPALPEAEPGSLAGQNPD